MQSSPRFTSLPKGMMWAVRSLRAICHILGGAYPCLATVCPGNRKRFQRSIRTTAVLFQFIERKRLEIHFRFLLLRSWRVTYGNTILIDQYIRALFRPILHPMLSCTLLISSLHRLNLVGTALSGPPSNDLTFF